MSGTSTSKPVRNVKYGPQAKDDGAAGDENALLFIDVLENDLASGAHQLWSLVQDNLALNTPAETRVTLASGAQVWFENGQVVYDPGASFNHLALGEAAEDSFLYAIRMSNGSVSYATVTISLTGSNDAPVAVADTAAGTENQILTVDVLANDADVDSGAAFTLVSAAAPANKGAASVADNKLVFTPGSDFDHLALGAVETVTLVYTLADEHGAQSSSTVTVTITGTNDGPVAMADTAAGSENETLTLDVLANDTDVDDGAAFTLIAASAPTDKGTASVIDNKLVFTPGSDFDHLALGAVETVTLAYTMADEHGAQSASTVTVTITGTNDGPVAVADTAAGSENQTLTLDALANDTDVDDGAAFTLVAASAPTDKGTASVIDNKLVFTPGSDFDHLALGAVETVTLAYTMADEHGAQSASTVTVTITGTNDGPVAMADTAAGSENETLIVDVLANDTDIDDGAAFTLVSASAPADKGAASVVDDKLVFAMGADFDHLAAGATETVELSYTMADEHGAEASSTVTVTITGTNDEATIGGMATGAVAEDGDGAATFQTVSGTLIVSDIDDGENRLQPVSAGTAGANGHGSFEILADGGWSYALDNEDAAVQALAIGETLTDTIVVTSEDGTASREIEVTIHGTNDAPVVTSNAAAASGSVTEAGNLDNGIVVPGTASVTRTLTSSDVDSGATAVWSGSANGDYGSFAINAAGVWTYTLDQARADTLNEGQNVTETFTATVTDDKGATATQLVSVAVSGTNDAPTAAAVAGNATEDGGPVLIALAGDDKDGEDDGASLVYTIVSGPSAGSASIVGDTLRFDPGNAFQDLAAGQTRQVTITYAATDARGAGTSGGQQAGPLTTLALFDMADIGSSRSLAADTVAAGVTATALTAVGALNGSPFSNHLYLSGWGTTLDPNKYYETIINAAGKSIDFETVSFSMENAGSGTSNWFLRSSADGFAANIATGSLATQAVTNFSADLTGLAIASGPITFRWYLTAPASLTTGFANHQAGGSGAGIELPGLDLAFTGKIVSGSPGQTATITVTGVNDAPVAVNDTASVAEDGSVLINVLANDTDADAGAVKSIKAGSVSATNGTASIQGTQVRFTPDANYNGPATVTYSVTDGIADSVGTVAVTVTSINDAPVAVADSASGTEHQILTIDVLANDTDVDAGATRTLLTASAPAASGSVSVVSNQLVYNPGNAFNHLADGQTQNVVLNYTMRDQFGAQSSSTATVTVTGTNDAPTIVPDTAVFTGAGYINVTGAAAFTGTGAYSYEVSFKTGSTNIFQTLLSVGFFTTNKAAEITVGPDGKLYYGVNNVQGSVIAGPVVADGQWHRATATYDGAGQHALYLDGALIGTSAYTGVNLTGGVALIGAANTDFRNRFVGEMAEAHVWNRALSAAEAMNLATPPANDPGLIGSYRFASGAAANSVSGMPNGTLTGTTTLGSSTIGSITEIAEGAAGESVATQSATGTLLFKDVDLIDTHAATATPQGGDYVGTFGLAVDQAANKVGWTYQVADAALDFLAAGQILTQTYMVVVDDGHGGTAEKAVTITLTGVNDAPAYVSYQVPDFDIDDGVFTGTGLVHYADPDAGDSFTVTSSNLEGRPGLGFIGSAAASLVAGSTGDDIQVEIDYAIPTADYRFLAAGETLFQQTRVVVTDAAGASNILLFGVTLTGVNDAPTDLTISAASVAENLGGALIGSLSASDADAGETFTYSIRSGLDGSLFAIEGNALRVGSSGFDYETSATRSVVVRATDSKGAFTEKTIVVQVEDRDEFTLTAGTDTLVASAANTQIITAANTLGASDVLNAGAGADSLLLFGSGPFNLRNVAQLTGIEDVRVINFSFSTATVHLRDGLDMVVIGSGTGHKEYYLSTGNDNVTGGSGSDYFMVDAANRLNAGDVLDGGNGSDALYLPGHFSNASIDLTAVALSNVETLIVYGQNNRLIVDNDTLANLAQVYGDATTRLVTPETMLDLRGKSISQIAGVESSNATGTNFLVNSAQTGFTVLGGAGNDTITATGFAFSAPEREAVFAVSSVETIVDSSGTYTAPPAAGSVVRLTTAADVVAATADDATINASAATLNNSDTLDGGAGTDTLALYGAGTFNLRSLTQFTGMEEIRLNNYSSSTATVYLRDGLDMNVVGNGGGHKNYWLSTGDDVVTGGTGTDYFYIDSATRLNAGDVLDGGNGFDTFYLPGNFSNATIDLTGIALSNTESIGFYGQNNKLVVDNAVLANVVQVYGDATSRLTTAEATIDLRGKSISQIGGVESSNAAGTNFLVNSAQTGSIILGGAGNDTITASGFAFSAAEREAIFAVSSVETIVDTSGTHIAPPVVGSVVRLTTAADIIAASADDTTFNGTAATLNNGDKLDGGTGADALALYGSGSFNLRNVSQFTGIEEIRLINHSSGSAALYLRDGMDMAVNGSGVGQREIFLSTGNDAVTGGQGTDLFMVDSPTRVGAGDVLNGGDGYDYFYLPGYFSNASIDLTAVTLSNTEVIIVYGQNNSLIVDNDFLANVTQIYGDASARLISSEATVDLRGKSISQIAGIESSNAGGTHYLVNSAQAAFAAKGGAGQDMITASNFLFTGDQQTTIFTGSSIDVLIDSTGIYGSGGDNLLTGTAAANTMSGAAGNDILVGGLGADILTGGSGADIFRFDAANEGADRIIDFASGLDAIKVSAAGFGGGLVAGEAASLVSGSTPLASGVDGQFLYDSDDGRLFWDADGGGAGAAVLLATFDSLPALQTADIVIG